MSSNSENDQNTQTGALLIFAIIIMLGTPYLWHHYIQPIYTSAWFFAKLGLFSALVHLMSFEYIGKHIGDILFWVNTFLVDSHLPKEMIGGQIKYAYDFLSKVDTSTIHSISQSFISNHGYGFTEIFISIGRLAFIIVAPIYFLISFVIFKKLVTRNLFNNKFSVITFAETMAEGFPELLPVVFDNPQNHRCIDTGKWRMSPKILPYLRANNCILDYSVNGVDKFKLDREATSELLEKQVGKRWSSFKELSKEERTVAAIAMPMVSSPKLGVPRMIKLIKMLGYAYSSKPGFVSSFNKLLKNIIPNSINLLNLSKMRKSGENPWLDFIHLFVGIYSGIKEDFRKIKYKIKSNREVNLIIKTFQNDQKIKSVIKIHAYDYTVIASLIEEARKGGKLPSCMSLWLKTVDRNLFYVFNNLGRQVGWIECLGFWAHYMAEKSTNAPFPYPKIENGIDGIDEYLWGSFYQYEPYNDWDAEYAD
ncbi:hypothetical protein [Photobacterium kishitanii]|uniref:DotM C-terminal cytoplasmic domain-containing protein n=1 Tax=Photobacterium kishitanii TaxID=318456 RepID=A0A2T3KAZ5_9GAMM|nr:hypothetical protein [Photobacterium kishitanii]PSU89775.1 hypothetical protein C9J27_24140 [Photobacterium kishitanii]